MGVQLISPGSNVWPWAGYRPVRTQNLSGVFVLGNSIAQSLVNYDTDGADLADLIGSPVVSPAYINTDNGIAYLDSRIPDTSAFTHIAVFRMAANPTNDATSADIISNLGGSAGTGMYTHSSGLRASVRLSTGSFLSSGPHAMDLTEWRIGSHSVGGSTQVLKEWTTGLTDTDNMSASHELSSDRYLIGSGYAGSGRGGELYIAAAMFYSVQLSNAQIAVEVEALKAFCTGRGITFPS